MRSCLRPSETDRVVESNVLLIGTEKLHNKGADSGMNVSVKYSLTCFSNYWESLPGLNEIVRI